jgi:hypothetical protein
MAVAAWEVQSPAHQCASKMRLQIASTAKRGPRPSVLVLASMLHVILGSNREVGAHPSFDSHTVTALMQARDAGVVRVAKLDDSFSVANVTGVSGEPAKLAILISEKLLTAAENQRLGEFVFLKFNGLPEELNFSAGFRSKDAWLVSIKDASGLELLSPPDYAGLIPVRATLYRGKDTPLQTHTFNINLHPKGQVQVTVPAVPTAALAAPERKGEAPLRQPLDPPQARATVGPEEEAFLLDRAGTFFQNGDFESARLIYAELADRGSGRAAWRMAQTFDPDVLKSFFVVGVEPNSEKAKLWYSRAAERGVAEARERLKVLSKAEPR